MTEPAALKTYPKPDIDDEGMPVPGDYMVRSVDEDEEAYARCTNCKQTTCIERWVIDVAATHGAEHHNEDTLLYICTTCGNISLKRFKHSTD